MKHGAKKKECISEGCTNRAVKGGVCIKHGAETKRCSSEGCTKQAQKGGTCVKHGAKKKLCSVEGCTNQAQRRRVCKRHGADRNTIDESTVFGGSKFEQTTAAQSQPNELASEPSATGQSRLGVPGEVVLCQEIFEV